MSGTAQRLKHAARIESQKHGHFLTLFSRRPTSPWMWCAVCVKCGQFATVNIATKKADPLVEQCNEGRYTQEAP